ncbi:hypothetical protein LR48_Vigan07g147600 [Vigna angularis]|uniref:Uncharacterized protein n=1 Tax=Phaseolus angularis TaxID=3914 RepID=A0A0L9UYV3_PHAAN|nr:hypothetical protein LR48_Vigan07g147600 [Vigna angularis]
MASPSSSSRRKEKVARITRNASPSRWINETTLLSRFGKGFYTNLRVVNKVIDSKVKGVNITIDDNVWSDIAGLKAEGLDSHIRDSESNKWLTKRAIYINFLRYPGRLNEDRMSTEDVFLLNAIKTRILTNWVAVLKHHMIAARDDYARKLPYGVFISKTVNGWFFIDEQTVGSPPTLDEDYTKESDDEDSVESS